MSSATTSNPPKTPPRWSPERTYGAWAARGAGPSFTAFAASKRTVQRVRPSGAGEHASANRRASNSPSKVTARGLRRSPSSPQRRLKCSIVRDATLSACAVLATVQAGPSDPLSQSSSARALRSSLPEVLTVRVRETKSLRSLDSAVTRYRGAMTTSSNGCQNHIEIRNIM